MDNENKFSSRKIKQKNWKKKKKHFQLYVQISFLSVKQFHKYNFFKKYFNQLFFPKLFFPIVEVIVVLFP